MAIISWQLKGEEVFVSWFEISIYFLKIEISSWSLKGPLSFQPSHCPSQTPTSPLPRTSRCTSGDNQFTIININKQTHNYTKNTKTLKYKSVHQESNALHQVNCLQIQLQLQTLPKTQRSWELSAFAFKVQLLEQLQQAVNKLLTPSSNQTIQKYHQTVCLLLPSLLV